MEMAKTLRCKVKRLDHQVSGLEGLSPQRIYKLSRRGLRKHLRISATEISDFSKGRLEILEKRWGRRCEEKRRRKMKGQTIDRKCSACKKHYTFDKFQYYARNERECGDCCMVTI